MTTAVAPREDRVAFYVRQARESMWAALEWKKIADYWEEEAFLRRSKEMAERAHFLLGTARLLKAGHCPEERKVVA